MRGRHRVRAPAHAVRHRAGGGPAAAGRAGGAGPARRPQPAAPRGQQADVSAERHQRPAAVVRDHRTVPEAQVRADVHDRWPADVRVPAVGQGWASGTGRRAAVLRRLLAELRVRPTGVRRPVRRGRGPGGDERPAGERAAAEPGRHPVGERRPVRPAAHRSQLPGRRGGRRRAGVGPAAGQRPGDAHQGAAAVGRHRRPEARGPVQPARVRHRPVLAVPGPVPHPRREPSRGHVQDGPCLRPDRRRRSRAARAPSPRRPRGRLVRVPDPTQLQSHRARRHGGREGREFHQEHVALIPRFAVRSIAAVCAVILIQNVVCRASKNNFNPFSRLLQNTLQKVLAILPSLAAYLPFNIQCSISALQRTIIIIIILSCFDV